MNKLKRTLAFFTALVMLSGTVPSTKQPYFIKPLNVLAEEISRQEYTIGDSTFIYLKYEDRIIIEGYYGNDDFVTIPDTIDDCIVTDVVFAENQYTENDNSDLIVSLTLPETVNNVELYQSCPDLMQIRGSSTGYAMDVAKRLMVSFENINANEYKYLKYEEIDDNIVITGIDFYSDITNYTIPDEINGKTVTEIEIYPVDCKYDPDYGYTPDYSYIPEQFTLNIVNPNLIFTSVPWELLEHCTAIYASPGSTAQVFAYNNDLNYVPFYTTESEADNNIKEYPFLYDVYEDENGEPCISINGINEENIFEIVIPETIDGIPVRDLRADMRWYKKITIPDSVQHIYEYGINDETIFYVNNGSYACEFAKQYNIPYKYIGLPDEAYFRYYVSGDNLVVEDYIGMDTSITIPDKMYGMDVTNVALEREEYNIEEITVPEKIKSINVRSSALKIVRGYRNSAAEQFVKENYNYNNNLQFVAIDNSETNVRYALYDDHAEIISCKPNNINGICEIPSKIKGRVVTKILSGAFNDISRFDNSYNIEYSDGACTGESTNSICYVEIPSSVSYIADDAFNQNYHNANILIKADAGSYAIDYAIKNNLRYEEIEVLQEDLSRYYNIEIDSDGTEYLNICQIAESFIDENGILRFPEEIDGITVRRIDIILHYEEFSFKSIYIPSSVSDINIRCMRNGYDYDYNYGYEYGYEGRLSDCISEIRGEFDSYAQEYAKEQDIKFTPEKEYKYNTSYIYCNNYEYGNGGYDYSDGNYYEKTISVICTQNVVYATIPEKIGDSTVHDVSFDCPYLKSVTFLNPNIEINDYDLQECLYLEEIRGYAESTAEQYARNHGIKFVRLYRDDNENFEYQSELTFNGTELEKCDISAVDVTIGEWVTNINSDAFNGCTALKSVSIPDSITEIPESLFSDCINLKEIYGCVGSAAEAYALNHNISFIAMQSTPRYIAYQHCYGDYFESTADVKITGYDTKASNVVIPEKINGSKVKMIGKNAFYDFQGTETVEIPEFIEEVERGAFYHSDVNNVVFPENNEYIEDVYFNDYRISSSITVLNPNAEIAYDVKCKFIGYYGSTAHEFAKQNNLNFTAFLDESDIAPDYLEYEICGQGDSESHLVLNEPYIKITNIKNVEDVVIPETIKGLPVKEFDSYVFYDSSFIKTLTVLAKEVRFSKEQCWVQHLENAIIYGYSEDNTFVEIAKTFGIPFIDLDNPIELPEGIHFEVLYDCVRITSNDSTESTWTKWAVPDSMYGLPIKKVDFPFETLEEIELPESVTYINLNGCPNLETLIINNSECTFDLDYDAENSLADIYAPIDNEFALNYAASNGITFHDINSGDVYYAPTEFEYEIKDDVVTIIGYSKDNEPVDLVIPSSIYGKPVKIIASYAFDGCTSLKTVVIPDSVFEIEKCVFDNCSSLERITVYGNPNISYKSLGSDKVIIQSEPFSKAFYYAFYGGTPFCDMNGVLFYAPENLKYDLLEDHIIIKGMQNAADECIIPESIYGIPVLEIAENAFCNSEFNMLQKVVIPESVTIIAYDAFPTGTVIWGYTGSTAEAYAEENGFEFVDIDIAEQNWDYIDWHWEKLEEDGTVTAELKSREDETYSRILNATVKIEEIKPTCTEEGQKTYIAEIVIDGSTYSDKSIEILDPTGHSYYVSEWIWSDDNSECTANFKCFDCDTETVSQNAVIKLETSVSPSCTEGGSDTYTAEITFDGKVHSNSITVETNATGHNYEIDSWNWSSDRKNCEVVLKCLNCDDTQTKTATVTHEELAPTCTVDGYDNYIAEVEINGEILSNRNELILKANGHENFVDKWIWSEERTSCVAELKCKVCDEITDSINATVEHTTLAPTCTVSGYDNYIAQVTIDGTVYIDNNNKIIPANGHDLFADSWVWSEDYTQCSVIVKCHNCDTVINDAYVVVSSEIISEPTYDETGMILYTATCNYSNDIFTTTKEVELPVKERTDISAAKVSISATSFEYDGSEKNVNVNSVKLNGVVLVEGVDYIITGNTATESGDYTLTVTGIGAYKGAVSKYWKIVKSFRVSNMQNGIKKTYIYTENAFCNVKASPVEGKVFSHWQLTGSDTILSYSESYTFRVVSDTSVEAVYVDDGVPVVKEPVIAVTSVRAFDNKIYYEITRDIPENYKVISNGILYGTSTSLFVESDDNSRDINLRFTDDIGSTTAKEKVYTATSSVNNNKGYYSYYLNVGTNTDRPIYLRGYVIIKDEQNNIQTYYTSIIDKTYNQILNK